ncbi:di-trans,poly-cis-decaprenylcistransferase [Patescibacteria group bacterium]|nr:di-trans,poly-cis-decaprenylcistransferase [Patescibacteria group bacterium]MBU1754952.1 di-trans,poly-cis-decaprenylcistransferase [Patescibacteria group bacterium]
MTNGPYSIGVIMDGNRRWAKEQGVSPLEGRTKGLETLRELMGWSNAAGIKEVTIYAFSTENWKRAPEEVSHLMGLIEYAFENQMKEVIEKGVKIRFIGDRSMASEKVQKVIEKIEERTKGGTAGTLAIAFSYGGRPEILNAVNTLLREGKTEVTDADFENALWTSGMQEPDLIIRTGGEKRLSNFLPWQSVYSELFFTDTKWPAFSKEEFDSMIEEFRGRERRRGK